MLEDLPTFVQTYDGEEPFRAYLATPQHDEIVLIKIQRPECGLLEQLHASGEAQAIPWTHLRRSTLICRVTPQEWEALR